MIWILVLLLLLLAVGGGIAVSKFLFFLLVVAVVLALLGAFNGPLDRLTERPHPRRRADVRHQRAPQGARCRCEATAFE